MAPILLLMLINHAWWFCLIIFYVAVLSDLVDGPLARSTNRVTIMGAKLDHTGDAVFVFLALVGLSMLEVITWWLCVVQMLSFMLYFFESLSLVKALRPSRLGKLNGIGYFIIAGIPITQNALQLTLIDRTWLNVLVYLLVISSLVSIAQRYVQRKSYNGKD